jgi:hypothetical protein
MEKEELSPKESLRIINEMIENSKERFQDNGYIYLFWGWLVLACALAQFILLQMEYYEIHFYPYFLAIPGAIYTFIYEARRHKESSKSSFPDKFFTALWIATGINLFIVGFGFSFIFNASPVPYILILIAIAVIVSGTVINFKPLVIGGIICNALAIASLFLSGIYHPIVVVLALIAAYLVPGYILRKQYKMNNV